MSIYQTTNLFNGLGKLAELKLELCTKKIKFKQSSCQTKWIKRNTQSLFDGEVLKKLRGQGAQSLMHSRKRGCISIKNYVKRLNTTQKSLSQLKEQTFFTEKLSGIVGKPIELWNTMKSLGMPKKTVVSNFKLIDNYKSLTCDIKITSKAFKDFF